MSKKCLNIIKNVNDYKLKMMDEANNNIQGRAFDLCYDYFKMNIGNLIGDNLQTSCMQLWSFLANWGMFRGGSSISQHNYSCLQSLILHFNEADQKLWEIDVDNYFQDNNIERIIIEYTVIKEELRKVGISPTITLVTKIILGVYASVPAFDDNFTNAFRSIYNKDNVFKCGFRSLNKESLTCIADFYIKNKYDIDECIKSFYIMNFNNKKTELMYSKAKIIDMFGFMYGQNNNQ